jgi:hypothetical protein
VNKITRCYTFGAFVVHFMSRRTRRPVDEDDSVRQRSRRISVQTGVFHCTPARNRGAEPWLHWNVGDGTDRLIWFVPVFVDKMGGLADTAVHVNTSTWFGRPSSGASTKLLVLCSQRLAGVVWLLRLQLEAASWFFLQPIQTTSFVGMSLMEFRNV